VTGNPVFMEAVLALLVSTGFPLVIHGFSGLVAGKRECGPFDCGMRMREPGMKYPTKLFAFALLFVMAESSLLLVLVGSRQSTPYFIAYLLIILVAVVGVLV